MAGADADLDIGVVEVDTGDAPAVTWEPDAVGKLTIGAPVLALSNPGGHGLRVTFGLVSATGRSFRGPRGRRIPGSIEHTAPLPRGSSGGPLVDPEGRLLGLNAVRREGGLILAVPADETLHRARRSARPRRGRRAPAPRRRARPPARRPQDARRGRPARTATGCSSAASSTAPRPRPPASQRGDLLIAAGDTPLTSADDLFEALDPATDTLTLRVLRGTEERDVEINSLLLSPV